MEIQEPTTFAEAVRGPCAEEWQRAAREEYDSLMRMRVWELQDLPPGRKPIGHRWVFKVKRNADGEIQRFKARLVAQGFAQKPGIDYFETYAPVAGLSVTRLLIAAAVQMGYPSSRYTNCLLKWRGRRRDIYDAAYGIRRARV